MLEGRRHGSEKADAWTKVAEESMRPCLRWRDWRVRDRMRIADVSSDAVGSGWAILSIGRG